MRGPRAQAGALAWHRVAGRTLAPAAMVALLGWPGPAVGGAVEACQKDSATGVGACLAQLTTWYGHDVLGGYGEWETLSVGAARVTLPEGAVFEDTHPRLADLGGDGFPEIVTVRSGAETGAAIVVYSATGGTLREIAATPPIGTRHRWRAIAGIADLDGRPGLEIAEVDRPHLAQVLRVWSFGPEGLTEIASERGFSNHRIGERMIQSAVRHCGEGPEIVMPDIRRERVLGVRVSGGEIDARDLGPWQGGKGLDWAVACEAEW